MTCRKDPEDPHAFERYQAEALVFEHLPASLLRGVGCYDENSKKEAEELADRAGLTPKVRVVRDWLFI